MNRALKVIIISIVAALMLSAIAYSWWIVPLSAEAGFVYTGGDSSSAITVTFINDSAEEGYSSLTVADEDLTQDDIADYILPSDGMTVYDDNPYYAYYFGGWYTSAQGGQKVQYGSDIQSLFAGYTQVTLYARWLSKASLTVTLQDLNYSLYNITFSLTCGENVVELNTSGSQTLTQTYYLNPQGVWSLSCSARTTSVTIASDSEEVEEGADYSYTVLLNAAGIANVPDSFTAL